MTDESAEDRALAATTIDVCQGQCSRVEPLVPLLGRLVCSACAFAPTEATP